MPSRDKRTRKDPFSWPRLVELGWVLTSPAGDICDEFSELVTPDGFDIPDAATGIHGISTSGAVIKGKPISEVLSAFCSVVRESDIIIAHNLSYDIRILITELIRAEMRDQLPHIPGYCTMKISASFCGIPGRFGKGYKWPSLSHLYFTLFHEYPELQHRALTDAQLCARCFHELKKKGISMKSEDIIRVVFPK